MPDQQGGYTQPFNARAEAAALVRCVLEDGRSLSSLKSRTSRGGSGDAQESLVQELCYGTLRWYTRLRQFSSRLLNRPFRKRDADLDALVLIGIYQLLYLDKPPHAIVHETVEATAAMGKSWARGVVNGIMRNCQRRAESLAAEIDTDPEARWAHPRWLLDLFKRDWPDNWQSIADENNKRPPMVLRVNNHLLSPVSYLGTLAAQGIAAQIVADADAALMLDRPVAVERLPGFSEGLVSIQDAAAQKAAPLLAPQAGHRVLDACAAPGGKTCHLLEWQPRIGELVALDKDPERLKQVDENLRRLNLHAVLKAADAAAPETWWDARPFDRILVDAPCSATGVIRRHPDIKILRRLSDIDALVEQQALLLRRLWPLLAPDGMLLYATCSVLARENHDQIVHFLRGQPDALELPLSGNWGRPCAAGRQILPGDHAMDGFYFALLKKISR